MRSYISPNAFIHFTLDFMISCIRQKSSPRRKSSQYYLRPRRKNKSKKNTSQKKSRSQRKTKSKDKPTKIKTNQLK